MPCDTPFPMTTTRVGYREAATPIRPAFHARTIGTHDIRLGSPRAERRHRRHPLPGVARDAEDRPMTCVSTRTSPILPCLPNRDPRSLSTSRDGRPPLAEGDVRLLTILLAFNDARRPRLSTVHPRGLIRHARRHVERSALRLRVVPPSFRRGAPNDSLRKPRVSVTCFSRTGSSGSRPCQSLACARHSSTGFPVSRYRPSVREISEDDVQACGHLSSSQSVDTRGDLVSEQPAT
jgi:hypothetical protein